MFRVNVGVLSLKLFQVKNSLQFAMTMNRKSVYIVHSILTQTGLEFKFNLPGYNQGCLEDNCSYSRESSSPVPKLVCTHSVEGYVTFKLRGTVPDGVAVDSSFVHKEICLGTESTGPCLSLARSLSV